MGNEESRLKIVTIGVYGFEEQAFFHALLREGVDAFIDLRYRRGMRQKKYFFVNSSYLQDKLNKLGIRYVHAKHLAPTPEIRAYQKRADKLKGDTKTSRMELSDEFKQAYEAQCLSSFDLGEFLSLCGESAKTIALFCVEELPEACHRGLLAKKLENEYGICVKHIVPSK